MDDTCYETVVAIGEGALNDDVRFQISVYDDNGAGEPGALIGGETNLSLTALGVPAEPDFASFVIDLSTPLVPTTSTLQQAR